MYWTLKTAFLIALLVCWVVFPVQSSAQLSAQWKKEIPEWVLKPGQMVDVGGYELSMYRFGSGSPVVVLESGGGWGAFGWWGIQEHLAEVTGTTVISYDRAAMNFSDIGPLEPPADQEVQNLRKLLDNAKIPGPYVLVGWSAGGVTARWFATLFPEDTAAVVTVDGSVFDFEPPDQEYPWLENAVKQYEECLKAAQEGKLKDDDELCKRCSGLVTAQYYRPEIKAAMGERALNPDLYAQWLYGMRRLREYTDAFRQVRKPLGEIPIWALVAGQHVRKPPLDENNFLLRTFEIAKTSDQGKVILLPEARHMIQATRTDGFVQAVEEAVQWARATNAKIQTSK